MFCCISFHIIFIQVPTNSPQQPPLFFFNKIAITHNIQGFCNHQVFENIIMDGLLKICLTKSLIWGASDLVGGQPTPVFLPGESQGRGAWWAAVYGITQSRTRLKWHSSSSSNITKNTTVNILFHLPLGTTRVCISVYSLRSGITGSTSLFLTLLIKRPWLGEERGGKCPSSPQGTSPTGGSPWGCGMRKWPRTMQRLPGHPRLPSAPAMTSLAWI